jgi:hypothetical protein
MDGQAPAGVRGSLEVFGWMAYFSRKKDNAASAF